MEFKDQLKDLLVEAAAIEQEKKHVQEMDLIVKKHRLTNEIKRINEDADDLAKIRIANYGSMSEEQIAKIQKENDEYLEAARHGMVFINETFVEAVPLFQKNLILLAGKTGEGKSTAVANIVYTIMKQPDNRVSPPRRRNVLVISNEEKVPDVYNRITCFLKGWKYVNHDKFTKQEADFLTKSMGNLARAGLTVIDDNHEDTTGSTTTLEGICQIFDSLIANKIFYDAIVIDYYQNVKFSKENPHATEWEVQAALAAALDRYKNLYPAPIVLFAQCSAPDPENKIPFKSRIEGRKVILNVATCCMEIVANKKELTTEFVVHKSRFNEAMGQSLMTGFDRGRYVNYDSEFKAKVKEYLEGKMAKELDKALAEKTKEAVKNAIQD